jgi:hypothetical protein
MFHKGYRCVSWFFGLVLGQSMCRRRLGFISVVFILLCINLLLLTRNALIFGILISVVQIVVPCCPSECSWSLGPVGTAGAI